MSRNDTVVTRVPKKLVEEITDYANKKYGAGTRVSFSHAALNYAIDNRNAREALNKSKPNRFL